MIDGVKEFLMFFGSQHLIVAAHQICLQINTLI